MKLITVSNIEKVFLTDSNLRGSKDSFIKALSADEIPYDIHSNGKIEVLFLDNPHHEDFNKRIENVFKKHVCGFSKIVWKTSPLNCGISNLKEIFIRDLENSLTIPVAQFKKELEKSSLNVSYGPKTIALRFKKPNFTYILEKYTSDFENVLKYVKTIDRLNWQ